MAIGDYTDFILDPQSFHNGQFNFVTQNINAFNGASNGAIRLVYENLPGHYANNISFSLPENIYTRRDITSGAAIASGDRFYISEVNERSVKLNRKVYIENTLDSFAKSVKSMSYEEASFIIGQQVAERRLKRQLNDSILSLRAALDQGDTTQTITVSSAHNAGKMNSEDLNTALGIMGDASGQLACLVMHSKAWRDLIGNQVVENIDGVSSYNLFQGTPATYGKPVLVTDSDNLKVVTGSGSSAYTEYFTLGLTDMASVVTVSENSRLISDIPTGYENLTLVLQGEEAYNMKIKGYGWDATNGGINPTDTALGTSTNWDVAMSSVKQRAGFVLTSR